MTNALDSRVNDRLQPPRNESGRVEAFSDGVFSIAITLLVLELAIPAIRGGFRAALADEWVSYVAYLAAFGTIGVLWMGHHTVFNLVAAVDTGLLWRNLLLLLTVSVVPFPTAVIASSWRVGSDADRAVAVVAYAVVGMLSGVAWMLLFSYLRRHPRLLVPHVDPGFFRLSESVVTLLGYAVAAFIGWYVSPAIALAIFLVFPVLYVLRVRTATG